MVAGDPVGALVGDSVTGALVVAGFSVRDVTSVTGASVGPAITVVSVNPEVTGESVGSPVAGVPVVGASVGPAVTGVSVDPEMTGESVGSPVVGASDGLSVGQGASLEDPFTWMF